MNLNGYTLIIHSSLFFLQVQLYNSIADPHFTGVNKEIFAKITQVTRGDVMNFG